MVSEKFRIHRSGACLLSLIKIRDDPFLTQLWAGVGRGITLPTSQIPLDFVWPGLWSQRREYGQHQGLGERSSTGVGSGGVSEDSSKRGCGLDQSQEPRQHQAHLPGQVRKRGAGSQDPEGAGHGQAQSWGSRDLGKSRAADNGRSGGRGGGRGNSREAAPGSALPAPCPPPVPSPSVPSPSAAGSGSDS